MRKNICLLMMLFVSILSAQEGNLTIKSGNQWNVCYKDGACSCFLRWENVVINDVTYIVERDKEYCYRQDGDRVYRCAISGGQEQLVLDYSLQVGDVFALYEGFSLQVESVSDTLLSIKWGEEDDEKIEAVCKRLRLRGIEQPSFEDEWIEMFGSMRYGINPPAKAEELTHSNLMFAISGGFNHLCTFSRNGVWGMSPILGEEYPGYIEEDPLEFTLKNDTLHIGGYIYNDCAGPLYMLVEEKEDKIILDTYELPEDADCYSYFKIDVSIGGLTREKYTINYGYRTFEVVQNETTIDLVDEESVEIPYYDLMGRPVANPTRGIYIKDGRKVVIGQ